MLRSSRMTQVHIVGLRTDLPGLAAALQEERLLHMDPFSREEGEYADYGAPLSGNEAEADRALRLRALSNLLRVQEGDGDAPIPIRDLEARVDELLAELEATTRTDAAALDEVRPALASVRRRISELEPFLPLSIPLETLQDTEAFRIRVGPVHDLDPAVLADIPNDLQLFEQAGILHLAIAYPRALEDTIQAPLSAAGFRDLAVPATTGTAAARLQEQRAEEELLSQRLASIEARLVAHRERHAAMVLALQELVERRLALGELPLALATTDHTFTMTGWVRHQDQGRITELVEEELSEYELRFEVASDATPVALHNPEPARSFEWLQELYALPKYTEIDPTIPMAIVFPIFFGLMVGDLGYGMIFFMLGLIAALKWRHVKAIRDAAVVFMISGACATFFGVFLFQDAFGLAFAGHGEYTWESILGITITLPGLGLGLVAGQPPIHKLEGHGILLFLVLSMVLGYLHLGLGFLFGIYNEWGRHWKHVGAKIGWLSFMTGIMTFLMGYEIIRETLHGTFLSPFQDMLNEQALWVSVMPMILGVVLVAIFETVGLMEIAAPIGNLLSYLRIAGIGVAKGAMAFAFNVVIISQFMEGGSIFLIAIGVVLLIIAHLIVLVLGAVSSGIQSIRLVWVEHFLKFFAGGGKAFRPFGALRKHTTTT